MSDTTRDPRRFGTRTWRPEVVAEPVARVQDEAVRAIMLARRRGLLQEVREIERRCGITDADDADPLTA